MKPKSIVVAVFLAGLVLLVSLQRYAPAVETTLAAAILALKGIEEWVKWITQIQVAALGALLYIVLDKNTLTTRALTASVQVFAASGLIALSLAIFISSWILVSLPSMAIRIHSKSGIPNFDVYEISALGIGTWPTLGNLVSTVHWLWAWGLICFAATVLGLLVNRHAFLEKTPPTAQE